MGLLVLRPSISSLLQSATAYYITKCDGLLLQSATGIRKYDDFITKCDSYYRGQGCNRAVLSLPCCMFNFGIKCCPLKKTIFEFRGSKQLRFPPPGFLQSRVITFFRVSASLCLFSLFCQNNFISLTDIQVQHLASLCRICGD